MMRGAELMRGTAFARASRLLSAFLALYLSVTGPAALAASVNEPPRFDVPASNPADALTFVVYADTRFTRNDKVVNSIARRALVARIALERPAAILIGGDLVNQGGDRQDYEVYRGETKSWTDEKIPVFPVLGNHELKGCDAGVDPCLENWWNTFGALRPYRWYSVTIGSTIRALILDSDSALKHGSEQRAWLERQIAAANSEQNVKFILIMLHYPPVREPLYPSKRDEKEVERYLSWRAKSLHAQVVVVGSHLHNYERYRKGGVTYLVSGGGGAPPEPAARLFGEQSRLHTSVNYHFIRFILDRGQLRATMVRFDATERGDAAWSEPDHFEIRAKPAEVLAAGNDTMRSSTRSW